jgi:hypothetical protein
MVEIDSQYLDRTKRVALGQEWFGQRLAGFKDFKQRQPASANVGNAGDNDLWSDFSRRFLHWLLLNHHRLQPEDILSGNALPGILRRCREASSREEEDNRQSKSGDLNNSFDGTWKVDGETNTGSR